MTNPLFLEDLAAMQSALRLSGVPDSVGEDANTIIGNALLTVRTGFYRRLGGTRVGQLVAITHADDPETDDEILRGIAETTEVNWTFVVLMDRLPMLWMDDSGGAWQQFNEQGTFRKMSRRDMEDLRKRMMEEIEANLDLLAGLTTAGDEGINVGTYGNEDCPRPRLGDTSFPPTLPVDENIA